MTFLQPSAWTVRTADAAVVGTSAAKLSTAEDRNRKALRRFIVVVIASFPGPHVGPARVGDCSGRTAALR
jgi:hypothetical protein